MAARSDEDDDTGRYAIEADTETLEISLGAGFFHDVDSLAFDRRVERVANAVRDALYLVGGHTITRH